MTKHAVSEEDRIASGQGRHNMESIPEDPLQTLEGLDVAGPQPE